MRITKKYAGASCIGKQVFQASEDVDQADVRFAEEELNKLEAAFLNRLHGKAGARYVFWGRRGEPNESLIFFCFQTLPFFSSFQNTHF
jgi:hypothetical protein